MPTGFMIPLLILLFYTQDGVWYSLVRFLYHPVYSTLDSTLYHQRGPQTQKGKCCHNWYTVLLQILKYLSRCYIFDRNVVISEASTVSYLTTASMLNLMHILLYHTTSSTAMACGSIWGHYCYIPGMRPYRVQYHSWLTVPLWILLYHIR